MNRRGVGLEAGRLGRWRQVVWVLAALGWGCAPADSPKPAPEVAQASAVPTRPAQANPADWCAPHAVPESMCTLCNPPLLPRFMAAGDYCREHKLPESVCPTCNPLPPPTRATTTAAPTTAPKRPAEASAADWCPPHDVPESMCTICNPHLLPAFKKAGDYCEEHKLPESVCPTCNPLPPPMINIYADDPGEHHPAHDAHHAPAEPAPPEADPEAGHGRSAIAPGTRIRFRDPGIAAVAGITTVPAVRGGIAERIDAPARLDHDRNRLADIRAPVAGIVRAVEVDLGAKVEAGQPLFVLESARIGDLQARRRATRARLDAARAELRRQETLAESAIASRSQVRAARRDVEEARAALKAIEGGLRIGGAEGDGRFVVRAPIDGVVVRRPAVLGTFADQTVSLATVVDPREKWALVDVPEDRAAAIAPGQTVELTITGQPVPARGTVDYVAAEIDPRTRAITARVVVPDPEGHLRAGAFARASIAVQPPADALTVPTAAIQRLGDAAVLFVRQAPGIYTPHIVKLGRSDGRRVQIAGDVPPDAPVVVNGAFLLRTELTRDAIGAGCCEVEGAGE